MTHAFHTRRSADRSRLWCHGFVRSRWVRESQRLKLLLQETRASKKGPAIAGPFRFHQPLRITRCRGNCAAAPSGSGGAAFAARSEEHTSELQSLMRISYAVFCLKKKKTNTT